MCGACCFIGDFKCVNLKLIGVPGLPNASYCTVHARRYTDMPIKLVDKFGNVVDGFCLHGSKAEEMELTRMIKEGKCSLEVNDNG
jgi:hypothetical protein